MTDACLPLSRRKVLAALGAAAAVAVPIDCALPAAAARKTLLLRGAAGKAALQAGGPELPRPTLSAAEAEPLRHGDDVLVRFDNALSQPALLSFRGLDGAVAAEPLISRQAVSPGGSDSFSVPLRAAGSFLADLRFAADGGATPMPAVPIIVPESDAPRVDGDQVLLIEDYRLGADGQPLPAGVEAGATPWLYTINGKPSVDVAVRTNGRFRLRFINACQRNVIAVKIDHHDVRVIALDSQPAEPFIARNGALVMAPGGRVDVLIDATGAAGSAAALTLHDGGKPTALGRIVYASEPPIRPAPLSAAPALAKGNLPAELPLGSALRVDLPLGALTSMQLDWFAPDKFAPAAGPAFQVKRGRTVVLALTNRATQPAVFHLHGHHFRLLDRLDDGWKPFWLDTVAIDAGQTQRVAFAAEYPGLWLMEAFVATWSAPRLLRSYLVG